MSEIWWNLSGTDNRCHSYGGGHWVHCIHHKHSVQKPGPVIPVTALVDDDGIVLLDGEDLCLAGWNHRPALVRTALRLARGKALWKSHWRLLVVPTGDLVDGASNVFSIAPADERSECCVMRVTNPDHLVPRAPAPTNLPPLRIAARYAEGRPKPS
jgi:hypothetical protein